MSENNTEMDRLRAERDAVAARLERALVLGAENRAEAERLRAVLADIRDNSEPWAARLADEALAPVFRPDHG